MENGTYNYIGINYKSTVMKNENYYTTECVIKLSFSLKKLSPQAS